MRLAVLYLHEDRAQNALQAAEVVTRLRPSNPWGPTIQGLAHAFAREFDAAERAFQSALRIDPDYGLAISELALIKEQQGERAAAIELFERALRLDTLTDRARARYARILQDDKRVDLAEEVLRTVIDDNEQFNSRRALVELLSDNDRQHEGIELLRRAAEKFNDWRNWADLGSFILARASDDTGATAAFEKSIAAGADDPMVFVSYAQALQRSGAPPARAIGVAKDLVARLPDDPDAWTHAGFLATAAGDKVLAEDNFRKAIDIVEDPQGWLALAGLLQSQPKRVTEAEAALRRAVALAQESRFCSPVRLLAEFLVHRGDEAAAHEAIATWFKDEEPCYCCAVLEGDMAARGGNAEAARNAYRNALQLRSEGIHALTGLSRFVDRAEGEKLIAQAMAADPTDHRCLLARARLREDDPASQIADAGEAVRRFPSYAEARLFLARVLLEQGEPNRALEHLKLSLAELPNQRELTPMFVDAAMAIATTGLGEDVSAILGNDEYGSTMEPLLIALRIKRGDSPIVAKEVLAVAHDIVTTSPKPHSSTTGRP